MVAISSSSPLLLLPAPRKTIPYYITNDPKGGSLFIYGKSDSPNKVIFCAGYPDDHKNGQLFCSNLAKQNDSLVGLMCLPGYDESWTTHQQHNSEGYTFDQMTIAIQEAVKTLCAESTNDNSKLTGIFHDWGVVPGVMWSNRSLNEREDNNNETNNDSSGSGSSRAVPDQLVLFDVLGPVHKEQRMDAPTNVDKPTVYDIIITLTYRAIFATSFLLQYYISKYVALPFFMFGNLCLKILHLAPCYDKDITSWKKNHITMSSERLIYMTYPYVYMFQAMFFPRHRNNFEDFTLPKDLKQTPVLYMYGLHKRVMFHDNRSVKYLEREAKEGRSKSNAISLADAGHWLYLQEPDRCLKEVIDFMST